jgi:hypothetical protein
VNPESFIAAFQTATLDLGKQPSEQARSLRFRPDESEIDVAARAKTHESDHSAVAFCNNDDLSVEPFLPSCAASTVRQPRLSLRLGIAALPVPDGVKHDVGQTVIIVASGEAQSGLFIHGTS